ncbi:MAG: ABC transporter permease [candidate division Zixibacteria bacterium]|nr:ABC transporter permease [candidate division Zixibacteria bacterium]
MKTDLNTNLRAIWGRAYVRVVGANRELSWLFFEVTLPLLAVFAFALIYRGLHAPEQYIGFVVVSGAMVAFWQNILWAMAAQFYWEKEMGNLELYLIAPVSRMAILLGMAVGGLFMTAIRAAAILIIGSWIFGVHYDVGSWLMLLVVFWVTMGALYGLGMLSSSLFMLYGREAWHTANLFQEPVYFISGFYFPVRSLGSGVAMAASLLPLTLGLDAIRQLLFSGGPVNPLLPVRTELVLLVIAMVLFNWAALKALTYMERLGKMTGRLTLKSQ